MVTLLSMDAIVEHCHLPSRVAASKADSEVGQNRRLLVYSLGDTRIAATSMISSAFAPPTLYQ